MFCYGYLKLTVDFSRMHSPRDSLCIVVCEPKSVNLWLNSCAFTLPAGMFHGGCYLLLGNLGTLILPKHGGVGLGARRWKAP